MKRYISLIRGINVSGQKKLKMIELKAMYESLKLENVVTYIQSGNVIFDSTEKTPAKLIDLIRDNIKERFGYEVSVFVYTGKDFEKAIKTNPFLPKEKEDFKKVHLTFLANLPAAEKIQAISNFKSNADQFHIDGQFIYLYCPDGYGRTKLSNNFFERKLKVSATTRNWNSVLKLYELVKA